MIDWVVLENAIQTWLTDSTGISTEDIFWAQQEGFRPSPPFITIRTNSIIRIGQDWVESEDTAVPLGGDEVTLYTRGQRELNFTIQCFAGEGSGAISAVAFLEAARHGANSESQRAAFKAVGLGMARMGPIQSIDGFLRSSEFEPRAVMEVTALITTELSETNTSIDTVEITDVDRSNTFQVPE